MRQESFIKRRKTRQIMVGDVPVGGDAPVSVQSMTNTETTDVEATVAQIRRLEAAGADIVRVSVPTMDAAEALALSGPVFGSHWFRTFTLITGLRCVSPSWAWTACASIQVI